MRLAALADSGLLENSAAARLPTLDRVARLAARATRAPMAQVNMITALAQIPAAAYVDATLKGPRGTPMNEADAEVGGAWRVPVELDSSYCKHVVGIGGPLVIPDASIDALVRDNKATTDGGIRAYLAAPLITPHGEVLGTVCVVDFQKREWTEDDISAVAECAALAGEEVAARLGAAHALRERESQLRAARDHAERALLVAETARENLGQLQMLTAALSAAVTSDDVARAAVRHSTAVLGAEGIIFVRAAGEETLEIASVTNLPDEIAVKWAAFPLSLPVPLADVARMRAPMFLHSRDVWREHYPALMLDVEAIGHHANAVAPLVAGDRLLGILGAAYATEREFDDHERALFLTVAEQCAQALERARLLDAERDARAEAEPANRAKSEFLAVMSHELRTPLNAIGGYAQLLEMGIRGPVTDLQRNDLQRLQASQQHLLGLINEVLNFARLEAGHVTYELERVQLDDVLRNVAGFVIPQAARKDIALEFLPCPDAVAMADPAKVLQIMVNLLSNAVKFTEAGGRITVKCSASYGVDAAMTAVHVHDSGIGIPPERLKDIFDPFVQVNAGFTRRQEGAGLGLAISRDLARGMGGDIIATSTVDDGSEFTLTLPTAAP